LTDYTQTRATGQLTLHRERLDLREVVAAPVRDIAGRSRREVRLDFAGDVTGDWDRGRVERVVVNLVNNALAYGAPATPVTVRVDGSADVVTIDVHNEGDPIPADLGPPPVRQVQAW
jgi:signal transduction histidine kinase